MKNKASLPNYLKIARDIAARVAKGDFQEGQRIYGRSVMATEYNASPETIRRALKLLSDMKVVDVKPQSGATVLSVDSAQRYINSFQVDENVRTLLNQLQSIKSQYAELNDRLTCTVNSIVQSRYSFEVANEPLPNYEVSVPNDAWLIGQSIGQVKFWGSTGCTIIAIRRGKNIILSPGPYAEFYGGDVLIFVGTPAAAETVNQYVCKREAMNDSV